MYRQQQALLIANDWFLYSNGNVTIYDATELPTSVANSFNLVLLGTPSRRVTCTKLTRHRPSVGEPSGRQAALRWYALHIRCFYMDTLDSTY